MSVDESFIKKLQTVQELLKAPKDKTNPFGKYKYRSAESIYEAVKPHLFSQGLLLTVSDEVVVVGGRVYIKATALLQDGKFSIASTAYAREPAERQGNMSDSQLTGSASSYARKYALNGLFCIDDSKDADTAEYSEETKDAPPPPPRKSLLEMRRELSSEMKRFGLSSDNLKEIAQNTFGKAVSTQLTYEELDTLIKMIRGEKQ